MTRGRVNPDPPQNHSKEASLHRAEMLKKDEGIATAVAMKMRPEVEWMCATVT
jgi:hypothetical protein